MVQETQDIRTLRLLLQQMQTHRMIPFSRPAATTLTETPSGAQEKSMHLTLDSVVVFHIALALMVQR